MDKTPTAVALEKIEAEIIARVRPTIEREARACAILEAVDALTRSPDCDYVGAPAIQAIRALATVPSGFVVVPAEPTVEQEARAKAIEDALRVFIAGFERNAVVQDTIDEIRALITARPK